MQTFIGETLEFVLDRGAVVLPVVCVALLAAAFWITRRGRERRGFWPAFARWAGLAACLLAAAGSAAAYGFQHRVRQVIAERAADMQLELLADGSPHTVADYKGQVVVLNFWATWCPPCRQEMPDLNRLAEAYRDRGVVVVTASNEERETIQQFAEEYPFATENALFSDAGPAPEGKIAAMAWEGRPTTLVLDREGHVRRLLIRAQSFETLSATVEALL